MAETVEHHAVNARCENFVLLAARRLLAETGYGAMSMRQLAQRAGLSAGSLYYHVSSKQDMLYCVILDVLEEREEEWKAFPKAKTPTGEIRRLVRFLLTRQRNRLHEDLMLIHEVRHLNNEQRHSVSQHIRHFESHAISIIQRGICKGVFSAINVESTAVGLFALVSAGQALRTGRFGWSESVIEDWLVKNVLQLICHLQPV